jgi:Uma2 family endonuclease
VKSLQKLDYFTYADYKSWDLDEGERYELINGVAYIMPAPTIWHQMVLMNLCELLRAFVKGKNGVVLPAPLDVCLYGKGDMEDNVVQPDIAVFCDKSRLGKKHCNATPDMVVEILSLSSAGKRRDERIKYQQYEFAGVREYWIVNPEALTVRVCVLVNGKYNVTEYTENDIVPVTVLEGCEVDMQSVFAE